MDNKIKYYILLFLIYTYLGSSIEHFMYFICKSKKKSIDNPIATGFPLYGLCALIITSIHDYFDLHSYILQFIIYGGIVTLVELIVGLCVGAGENGYNADGYICTWDYSNNYLHYKGIISVDHYIMWGILGLILVYANKYISEFVIKGIS